MSAMVLRSAWEIPCRFKPCLVHHGKRSGLSLPERMRGDRFCFSAKVKYGFQFQALPDWDAHVKKKYPCGHWEKSLPYPGSRPLNARNAVIPYTPSLSATLSFLLLKINRALSKRTAGFRGLVTPKGSNSWLSTHSGYKWVLNDDMDCKGGRMD